MFNHLKEIQVFMVVAEEKSFTKAANRLNTSQSAVSQAVKNLETKVGIKLLSRTTRSVLPTKAGDYLLNLVTPALNDIETGLTQLSSLSDNPKGTLRISADDYTIATLLNPAIQKIAKQYPNITIEVSSDYEKIDIVKSGFDAGIRRGGLVAKDMIAVQIGKPNVMVTVATPDYFAHYGKPKQPSDIIHHRCIGLRLPTHGALFRWRYQNKANSQTLTIDPRLVFSSLPPIVQAAENGLGLAYLPKLMVEESIENGTLLTVLNNYQYTFEPYYLYYPHRREHTPLIRILLQALI